MADPDEKVVRRRSIRKASQNSYLTFKNAQKELREKVKKVTEILKKPEHERSTSDKALVFKNPEVVKTSQKNARRLQANKDRLLEIEDEPLLHMQKCEELAELIKSSKQVVVYTGAGISTAASIPDYRGPKGVWTMLKKGHELSPQDLSDAEPTFTHMSLAVLQKIGKVKHIVSQNCDGLHIRSGYPRHALSEVHGNMYIECCYNCAPHKEYVRLFDVTERTGVHRHDTTRRCRSCGVNLKDTIVHFGEKGKLKSPYRWKEAVRAAKNADLILCLGSSLKVLRKYACLWCMEKKPLDRPKLVVVNLQWTPKDDVAALKINGKCDEVMLKVMDLLNLKVPEYEKKLDPIFKLCTPLRVNELKSTSKKILIPPPELQRSSKRGKKTKISSSPQSQNAGLKLVESGGDEILPPTSCKMQSDNETKPYTALNHAGIRGEQIENQGRNSQDEVNSEITNFSSHKSLGEGTMNLPNGLCDNPGKKSCNILDLKVDSGIDFGVGIPDSFSTFPHDIIHPLYQLDSIGLEISNHCGVASMLSKDKDSNSSTAKPSRCSLLPLPTEQVHSPRQNNCNKFEVNLSNSTVVEAVSSDGFWDEMSVEKERKIGSVPQLVIVDLGDVAGSISMGQQEHEFFLNSVTDSAAVKMEFFQSEQSLQQKHIDLTIENSLTSCLPQDLNSASVDVGSQSAAGSLEWVNFLSKDKTVQSDVDLDQWSPVIQLGLSTQSHPNKCTKPNIMSRLNVDACATSYPEQNSTKHSCIQDYASINPVIKLACFHSGKEVSTCQGSYFPGTSPIQSIKDPAYPLQVLAILPQEPHDRSKSQASWEKHSGKNVNSFSECRKTDKYISLDHCYTQKEGNSKRDFRIHETPNIINSDTRSIKVKADLDLAYDCIPVDPAISHFEVMAQPIHNKKLLGQTLLDKPVFSCNGSVSCNVDCRQFNTPQIITKYTAATNDKTAMQYSGKGLLTQLASDKTVSNGDIIVEELPFVSEHHSQRFHSSVPKNVPSCILNMDDMETMYKPTDRRFEDKNTGSVKSNLNTALTSPAHHEVLLMEWDSLKASEKKDVKSHRQVETNRSKGINMSVDNFAGKRLGADVEGKETIDRLGGNGYHPPLHSTSSQQLEQETVRGMKNFRGVTSIRRGPVHDKNGVLKPQWDRDMKGSRIQVKTRTPSITVANNERKKELSNHHEKIIKEGRENVCKRTLKQKLTPSVPGWFGKGLAIKRKKK